MSQPGLGTCVDKGSLYKGSSWIIWGFTADTFWTKMLGISCHIYMKDWIWWIRRWDLFWAMKKGPPGCWYFSGCFILASYVLDYFKKIYKDPYEKHAVSSQAISFCCFFRFSTVSNHPGSGGVFCWCDLSMVYQKPGPGEQPFQHVVHRIFLMCFFRG